MNFDTEAYLDVGASLQDKLLEKILDDFDDFFNDISIKKYESFLFRLIVTGDTESIVFKGLKSKELIVEYRYPLSEFKKILIKDKADFFASLVINSLTEFYVSENLNISEIETLKLKYIT